MTGAPSETLTESKFALKNDKVSYVDFDSADIGTDEMVNLLLR